MRLHLSALPGSKSVELLISWIAITNAMNCPTQIGVCSNSPPNRTSAEAACVMPRTSSAVRPATRTVQTRYVGGRPRLLDDATVCVKLKAPSYAPSAHRPRRSRLFFVLFLKTNTFLFG